EAKTPVEGMGVPHPEGAFRLANTTAIRLGEDFLMESEVIYPVYRDR
ncbi:MAG: riboflavin biosynthesis protein RibD, partial [Oscillospiraceae bacterium]|nr:riboflavin biosynthesis protein RibD [Oscillospiraceae bacterium]